MLLFLFLSSAAIIVPNSDSWLLATSTVANAAFVPQTYFPFSFTPNNTSHYIYDGTHFVNSPTDRQSIAPGSHWSYCAGELRSGRMRRHCYTGDPVLEHNCSDTACGILSFTAHQNSGLYTTHDGRPILQGNPEHPTILSLIATPNLRFEIKNNFATVYQAEDPLDSAGSYLVCAIVVVALAHLTAGFPYVCATCNRGSHIVDQNHLETCPHGFNCAECTHTANNHAGLNHPFTPAQTPPRSVVATNSGIASALRLSAGLIAAAAVAALNTAQSVLVAELDLGPALYALAPILTFVAAIAVTASLKKGQAWAHLAFLTCETLLLVTLAYSLPKAYGENIAAALLLITGIGAALVAGRTLKELASLGPLNPLEIAAVLAVLALIATLMVFPALSSAAGISPDTLWPITAHLTVAAAAVALVYTQ